MKSENELQWVVALAEGFKKAGCLRSPIVPDPEVIRECILARQPAEIPFTDEELKLLGESPFKMSNDPIPVFKLNPEYITALERLFEAIVKYAVYGTPTAPKATFEDVQKGWQEVTEGVEKVAKIRTTFSR